MDNKKALIVLIAAIVVITAGVVIFSTNIKKDTDLKGPTSNIQLEEQEEPKENINEEDVVETFNVTFDSNAGSIVESQVVEKGGKVTKPSNPTREGYTFVAWMLNDKEYNFESEVAGDIYLKAEWKKVEEKENETKPNTSEANKQNTTTNTVKVATPVITIGSRGGVAGGTKGIELKLNSKTGITGVQIYSATTKNGTYKLLKTVTVKDWKTATATVYAEYGQHLYFKVRTYVKNSAGTFYSAYSNVLELNNSIATPTLATSMGGPGSATLDVAYKGAYADGATTSISGWELYEKNGSKYTLIHTSESNFIKEISVDVGESKTYVARVYAYNKSKVKVYSAYSNEIKVSNKVATPTLATSMGGPGSATLDVAYKGAYADGATKLIDGWELYEKNGSKYTLIHTSESNFIKEISVDVGESKTYVARVYAYNKSSEKFYSAYSNTIVISNIQEQ